MTEKLFYEDGYQKEFTAEVLNCLPLQEGTSRHYQIILDRTAFFPEGGGQYADKGLLDEVRVLDVQEEENAIVHITDGPLEVGTKVTGKLDWDERFMKMQQHTGEHIVSGIVHGRFGYNNVGFHLGSEDCTMDFDGDVTKEQLREIEWEANQAVVSNLEVQVSYPSKEELKALDYRSKIEIEGQVRIITVPGFDVCACCAPHVKRTGEIGLIKLTNVQHYKGGVRITMLCGFRALADYDAKEERARAISMSLCAKENEIDEAVEHLKNERDQLKMQLLEMHHRLLEEKLSGHLKTLTEDKKGAAGLPEKTCIFADGLNASDMKYLMNRILEKGAVLAIVISPDNQDGFRYIAGSKTVDVREVSKLLNAHFDGRGGGKPDMVQGACKNFIGENEIRRMVCADSN